MPNKLKQLHSMANPYRFFIKRSRSGTPAFVRLIRRDGSIISRVCYKSNVRRILLDCKIEYAEGFNELGMILQSALGDNPLCDSGEEGFYPITTFQWKRRGKSLRSDRVWGQRHVNSQFKLTLKQQLAMFAVVPGHKGPGKRELRRIEREIYSTPLRGKDPTSTALVGPDGKPVSQFGTARQRLEAAGEAATPEMGDLIDLTDADGNEVEVWGTVGEIGTPTVRSLRNARGVK